MARIDGDGWVQCGCGRAHWGRYGAAGLLLTSPDGAVLLQHRAKRSHHGDTWGLPGGARASGEPAHVAALREATEEAGIEHHDVQLAHTAIEAHPDWSYTTVVGQVPSRIAAYPASWESQELRWVTFDDVEKLPLHPGFAATWPPLREEAGRRLVVFVDAANVVGARPDGWWRDRLGANTRLRDALAALTPGAAAAGVPAAAVDLPGLTWWPDLHLVVEGQARGLGSASGVTVHAAPADGDSHLARLVATARGDRPDDHVIAVTADRELQARVQATGASVIGPRELYAWTSAATPLRPSRASS